MITIATEGLSLVDDTVPAEAWALVDGDIQRAMPLIAKDPTVTDLLAAAARQMATRHDLHLADSRDLSFIPDESVHLALTSPPNSAMWPITSSFLLSWTASGRMCFGCWCPAGGSWWSWATCVYLGSGSGAIW